MTTAVSKREQELWIAAYVILNTLSMPHQFAIRDLATALHAYPEWNDAVAIKRMQEEE